MEKLSKSRLFDSIFFDENGSLNSLESGVRFENFGYRYNVGIQHCMGILSMYDESGFIFCTIKKEILRNEICEFIAVRSITDSEELMCQDWIYLNSDSELMDWMMKNRQRVAEWLLWRP